MGASPDLFLHAAKTLCGLLVFLLPNPLVRTREPEAAGGRAAQGGLWTRPSSAVRVMLSSGRIPAELAGTDHHLLPSTAAPASHCAELPLTDSPFVSSEVKE